LDLSAVGSTFERDFLLSIIPDQQRSLAFVFDARRERKSLGASAGNQGRVDFSLEIPYFVVDTRQSVFKKEVEVKNRKKFIVEVDGRRYHEQLIDDQKDFEIAQLGSKLKHIREGFVFEDIGHLLDSLKESDYLNVIDQNFTSADEELRRYYSAVLGPLGVARVQQVILKYLLNFSKKQKIRIALLERDLVCGEAAILDLQALLDNLYDLTGKEGDFFKLDYDVFRSTTSNNYLFGSGDNFKPLEELESSDYDLVIDVSVLTRSGIIRYPHQDSGDNFITIRNAHFSDQESLHPIISAECIVYRDLVEVLPNEQFKEIPEAKKPLLYFLNLLFRMIVTKAPH
jgi:ATP-dependent DNA helicase RecQ